MNDGTSPKTIDLPQLARQNWEMCLACAYAVHVDDDAVTCSASGKRHDWIDGRCQLNKWPDRPELPGVWVLSSPRTGSYYLSAMLNRLGFYPPLAEWCHQTIKQRLEMPPRNNKIHYFQLGHRGVTIEGLLEKYPDTRFIVLRRKDHVACAVSNYIGDHTHMLLITTEQQAKVYAGLKPILFEESDILACYARVQEENRFWSRHLDSIGVGYHTVFYEDLVSDPAGTIQRIFNYLGITEDPAICLQEVSNRKQSPLRPESKLFIDRLRAIVNRDLVGGGA